MRWERWLVVRGWRREHRAHRGKKEIHGEIEEKNSLLSVYLCAFSVFSVFLPGGWRVG